MSIVILGGMALVAGLIAPRPLARAAQTLPPRAGLIVRFGDGSTRTACVELGPDGVASGEEVLLDSGLSVITKFVSGEGTLTCKIEQEGCPKDDCLCACPMESLGKSCRYWAYYHLGTAGWEYSGAGASRAQVYDGAVEGWSWGAGDASGGVVPPPISFGEICLLPATATPTPTPTATAVPSPTTAPTATAAPAPAAPQPIIMPIASSTPRPPPSVTATPSATLSPTASPAPSVTSGPSETTDPPSPTPEPPSPTPEPPSLTPEPSSPTPEPAVALAISPAAAGGSAATATVGPLWLPLMIRAAPAATPRPLGSPTANRVVVAPTAVTSDTPTSERAATGGGLFWFLALSGALALALVAVHMRREG